jgi:lysophospholipase L1-like esterase
MSSLAVLCGLEGAVRWLQPRRQAFSAFLPPSCQRRSRHLGVAFAPNCDGIAPLTAMTMHTNSLGLRDDEIAQDGTPRILSIGDSCTFGWNVALDAAYPRVLQELIDRRWPARRHRVVNAGVPGYTSFQGLVYLREHGLALAPSVVVIGYGFNDAGHFGDVEELIRWQARMMPLFDVDDALFQHSELWRWLHWMTEGHPQQRDASKASRVSPERYEANLREMVTLARAHGVEPLLIQFLQCGNPQLQDVLFGSCQAYVDASARVAAALRVPNVDYDGPVLDSIHPTEGGYRELAGRVLQQLESASMLERGHPLP